MLLQKRRRKWLLGLLSSSIVYCLKNKRNSAGQKIKVKVVSMLPIASLIKQQYTHGTHLSFYYLY